VICIMITGIPLIAHGIKNLEIDTNTGINRRWFGDYEQMVQKHIVRVLVPHSKTFYFIDGATPRGATYDALKEFEKYINKNAVDKILNTHLIIIPTARDRLIPALKEGKGDIAAGNLTITDNRKKKIDFSDPLLTGINEILVAGSNVPKIRTLVDLSGLKIYVRKSSSYYESLKSLNKQFSSKNIPLVKIIKANEFLEDEDLLEMVNAGLIPRIIIDSHKGHFWAKIFKKITLYPDIKFRETSQIAWAIRKNSPELKKKINAFVKKNKKGTLFGNIIFNKYLKNTKYINNHYTGKDKSRFESAAAIFKKYANQYKFDWLMLAALAYQESTIDQSKRSPVGAIGVMQILPSTAKDKNVNILDIKSIEPNIHAGTKYLRYIMDQYFNDPALDTLNRTLLTFASYNAGPSKILRLRREAKKSGFDPNVWFRNVEIVAANKIGRETVQYVSNIFKYYIAYSYIINQ
jgi:membrane-bound lytic murein transglycosylase MltF